MKYTSMLNNFYNIVDCRTIAMHMDFFLLGEEKVLELRRFLYDKFKALYNDSFVCQWTWNNRKRSLSFIEDRIDNWNFTSVGCEAYVKSDKIKNMSDFRKIEKALFRLSPIEGLSICSVDYPDEMKPYWDRIVSPETCKEALLEIYSLPGKINKNYWRGVDSSFHISIPGVIPYPDFYIKYPNSICGYADFYIALNAVDDPNKLTDYLISVLQETQEITSNYNACVSLASGNWLDIGCFGVNYDDLKEDIQTGLTKRELDGFSYANYFGWYNIFSPIIAEKMSCINRVRKEDGIAVASLNSGAIEIKFKNDINQFDINDAAQIKRVIYPVIRPAELCYKYEYFADDGFFRRDCGPRSTWNLMPVFGEEIIVERDGYRLQHQSFL